MRGCPSQDNANVMSLCAVTPHFNRTDCVELTRLGTCNYSIRGRERRNKVARARTPKVSRLHGVGKTTTASKD